MDSQSNTRQVAETDRSTPSSNPAHEPTSSTDALATRLALYGAVPALTLVALQFAAGDFDPLEFIIDSYGFGGHGK